MGNRIFKYMMKLGITIVLVASPLLRGAVSIWAMMAVAIIIMFLVFLWLLKVNNQTVSNGWLDLEKTPLDILIFSFVLLAFISFAFARYKYASMYALLQMLSYTAFFYLIVNNYGRRIRRYIIRIVIYIGSAISVYGLLQYLGLLPHNWWIPDKFLSSTYVNHNHFSGYLELAIPVAIGSLIRYRRVADSSVKIGLMAAITVMAMAFIFSQSRAAWVCLAISLITMNIILIRRKILGVISVLALIVIFGSIFSFAYYKKGAVKERIESMSKIMQDEASFQTRVKIWQGTFRMIAKNPVIGTGIGTFETAFPLYRVDGLNLRANYTHNDYLQMASDMGILAPFIMILLLVTIIKKGVRMGTHPVVLGCTAGILSLSLHGLVDFNFHIPANMILFVIYIAIIIGDEKVRELMNVGTSGKPEQTQNDVTNS